VAKNGEINEEEAGDLAEEAYEMSEALENDKSSKEYVYVEEPEGGASSLAAGTAIVHLFTTGWERGIIHSLKKVSKPQKQAAKDMEAAVYVRHVLDEEHCLHDLGSDAVNCISKDVFERLASGESTEDDEDVAPGAWYAVKLESVMGWRAASLLLFVLSETQLQLHTPKLSLLYLFQTQCWQHEPSCLRLAELTWNIIPSLSLEFGGVVEY